jgi:hypothetical protein
MGRDRVIDAARSLPGVCPPWRAAAGEWPQGGRQSLSRLDDSTTNGQHWRCPQWCQERGNVRGTQGAKGDGG